jgi:hypothetical protein
MNFSKEDFPYRKYDLSYSVKDLLEKLLSFKPVSYKQKWSLPYNKIIKKIPDNIYYLTDIVIAPSSSDHWWYDKVIDYYSENARINTPGYGEKYSVMDYWVNTDLHKRWFSKNGNYRELLYENITEARPAYASVSISLYNELNNMRDRQDNTVTSILDITAYGERAIAAAALDYNYDGVDPNYDLIEGHTKLLMDLRCIKPNCNINFYYIGLEDYKSNKQYDIITYSPPPYDTEPYSETKKELQTYMKYPTYIEYICCFLTEIIYKAKVYGKDGSIFAFTMLDRITSSIKIYNKQWISDNTELIYTELVLLITSSFGFKYNGAIGLSVGGKPARVPWWVFKNISEYEDLSSLDLSSLDLSSLDLLHKYYPNIFERIGSRLLSNLNIPSLFNKYVINTKYETFDINTFKINGNYLTYEQKIFLELVRIRIQEYVSKLVESAVTNKNNPIRINKIRSTLGRYLMLSSVMSSYNEPYKSGLYVDPVFPVNISDEVGEQIVKYFDDKYIGKEIIFNTKYWFGSYECTGLKELYTACAYYITTIPLSKVSLNIKGTQITGDDYTVSLLNNIPGIRQVTNVIWKSTYTINLINLRYDILAVIGHQYTRPKERTKIIEQLFGEKIIDIYASAYNSQSDNYCSIYPDVESMSYGSAFQIRMKKGAFLANPVDIPLFVSKSIDNIIFDLKEAEKNNESLKISMGFTLWLDTNPYFDRELLEKKLNVLTDNEGLNRVINSKYIRCIYILNQTKFPSVLAEESHTTNRGTLSVGAILTSLSETLNVKYINKLSDKDKFIII